jgi:hypothetical protein
MAVYNPSGGGNVHVDKILTDISIAWPNDGLVGSNLFPVVTVQKQTDKYYIFGREAWLPEKGDYRAPGTEANEIAGMQVSTDTYFANEHALQIAVTDEERSNADSPLSPDRDATEYVTQRVMLGREVAMQTIATTAANYSSTSTTTLSGTSQWNDYVNSDPINNLRTGKTQVHNRIFMDPTVGVVPYSVMVTLQDHPDFLERIKYSERAIFSQELLGAVLGLPKIVVPGVGVNTANEGQPATLGYLWGKDVVLAYVPPRAGLKIPAFGYEFQWGTQFVDRWREDRRASDLIRVRRRYDLKLPAQGDPGTSDAGLSIAGYLIKAAIA